MIIFGALGPSNRRKSAGAIVVAIVVIILRFPLAFTLLLGRRIGSRIRRVRFTILAPVQTGVGEGKV